jgi:hypothetical protein
MSVRVFVSILSTEYHDTQEMGCALTQLATRWPLTTETRVRSQAISWGICG